MRRFRGYLFDLDGTLVDSAPDIRRALNAALETAGLAGVDEQLTRHWVGFGSRVLLEQALAFHGRPELAADETSMARLLATFIEYYRAHIADLSRPYPGVIEALDVLEKQGARFAVVTNKYAMLSVEVLQALDLHRYFEAIIGGDTLPQRKPDPAPALHACKLIGCAPAETLFVGDSSTDVETARAAGCPVVCVRDGYNHGAAAESLGADAVIDSFLDLL